MRILALFAASLALLSGSPAFAGSGEPTNDDQKTLYALGLAISQSLGTFALSESELDFVKSGLTDGALKRTPKADLQTFGPKIQQLQQARATVIAEGEKKAGAAYLTKAAAEKGSTKTDRKSVV